VSKKLALLAVKTASTATGGGVASLTPEMVAAACSGLKLRPYLYARVKYALDDSVKPQLTQLMIMSVWRKSKRDRWRYIPGETRRSFITLVAVALEDSLNPRKCKSCNGSGMLKTVCKTCDGTGNGQPISGRELAKLLDVSYKRVRLCWGDRFRDVQSIFLGFEHEIHEHIENKLRG
jgi:hypothetical protein